MRMDGWYGWVSGGDEGTGWRGWGVEECVKGWGWDSGVYMQ